MLNFQVLIAQSYTYDEFKALNDVTKNIHFRAYSIPGYNEVSLLPLSIINKDKILTIRERSVYSMSGQEATNDYLNNFCFNNIDLEKNEYLLSYIHIKRGNTFVYNFLQKEQYESLNRVAMYLQQGVSHKIQVYKKGNRIVVVTNLVNDAFSAALFSAYPLLYKNEFNWDEDTIEYFRSATETDAHKTFNIFQKIVKKYRIIEEIKRNTLKQTLEFAANLQCEEAKNSLARINKDITAYEEQLYALYRQQKEKQAFISFFKADLNTEEVADYILNNPYIVDYYQKDKKYFVVAVEAPLEFIDIPALKRMLSNTASYLYPQLNAGYIPEKVRTHTTEFIRMLKDLFLSNKYKVYTRSEVVLDFIKKQAYPLRYAGNYSSSSISSNRPAKWKLSRRYKDNPDRCITPHMHIEFYDCWAGNKTNIAKSLNKSDIIGALDIVISTTKDINVNDSAVFGRFIREGLFNPSEFLRNGYTTEDSECMFKLPGSQFKTIYDIQNKCFRTFDDIFENDYLKEKTETVDTDEPITEYI